MRAGGGGAGSDEVLGKKLENIQRSMNECFEELEVQVKGLQDETASNREEIDRLKRARPSKKGGGGEEGLK